MYTVARIVAMLAAMLFVVPLLDRPDGFFPSERDLSDERMAMVTMVAWTRWLLDLTPVVLLALVAVRRFRPLYPVLIVAIVTGMLHAMFFLAAVERVDRLRGLVVEPQRGLRALAFIAPVTLALALLYAVVARRAGLAAVAPLLMVATLLMAFFFFTVLTSIWGDWFPPSYYDDQRYIAFRPCRGALVFDDRRPILRIEEVWQQFHDPRGARVSPAISGGGLWREEYLWLTFDEARAFVMRSDDPKVIRCDGRARREPVRPANWHRLGFTW